jgi:hypothetical protein
MVISQPHLLTVSIQLTTVAPSTPLSYQQVYTGLQQNFNRQSIVAMHAEADFPSQTTTCIWPEAKTTTAQLGSLDV